MATRILILTPTGAPLHALDGHHGATHAARWCADVIARCAALGIQDPIAIELTPEQGGDAVRQDITTLHRLRLETRRLPDGNREIIALNRLDEPRATPGEEHAARKQMAAATPQRVRAQLRLLHAPPDIAGRRHPVRITRGRTEPLPGTAATPQQARLQRRLAANKRPAP